MTDQQHPSAPPLELVQQWVNEWMTNVLPDTLPQYIATQAARWGADQNLEACRSLLDINGCPGEWIELLRIALRPKPPSLAEEALEALEAIKNMADDYKQFDQDVDIISRALERLRHELEGQDDG